MYESTNLSYTEDQFRVMKEYGEEALETFQIAFAIFDTEVVYDKFVDSYINKFDSIEDFITYYIKHICKAEIPLNIVVDYKQTWNNLLCDYLEYNLHFFRNIL